MREEEWAGCFEETYAAALAGFQRDAARAGFELSHYAYHAESEPVPLPAPGLVDMPEIGGRDAAWCSVARYGRADASRALVVVSGTHGVEGYLGSSAQRWLMRCAQGTLERVPARDAAIVLIHAVNPWGFLRSRRTTETNIDLNRNFLDWSAPAPSNERYAELHEFLKLAPGDLARSKWPDPRLALWVQANGVAAYFDTLTRGQYSHADGLFYGGHAAAWSNRVLRDILARHCGSARRVGVIDWHTGVGQYAKPYFICFDEPGSEGWRRCERWWGEQAVANNDGFAGAPRPRYTGLVFHGLRSALPAAQVSGCVIEIGTYPPDKMIEALAVDNCLNTVAGANEAQTRLGEAAILRAFYPSDPAWREGALGHAAGIQLAAIGGVLDW